MKKRVICRVCQKPNAKRKCPAINGYLCSLCCGNKRKREINCPLDCEYLTQAQNQWIQKLQISSEQIKFWQTHFDIIHNIALAILQVTNSQLKTHRCGADMTDIETKEAIENLIKTCEIEARGVIYDYKSSNYRIQTIQHRQFNRPNKISLTTSLKSHNQPETNRLREVSLAKIISSLKFILDMIKQCINKKISNSAFLNFILYFTGDDFVTVDLK